MKIYTEFKQYSPDYWRERCGLITASDANKLITPTGKVSASAEKYIAKLISDRLYFDPNFFTERPISRDMQHGTNCEPESRRWYAMEREVEVQEVGGVLSTCGRFWASPDGLIGDDGVLELKNPSGQTQIEYLIAAENEENYLPPDYWPQVHFQLVVTQRSYVDFVSYRAFHKPLVSRIVPNEYTLLMAKAMDAAGKRLDELWAKFNPAKLGVTRKPGDAE